MKGQSMAVFPGRAASDDLQFVEQRREVRVVVRVPGRCSLANRRDSNGNCRQFACRAVSISATNLILATSVSAAIRERVVAYFEEFGEIQGAIVRVLDGGIDIWIVANSEDRARLLHKLVWLEKNANYDIPDVRKHKRRIPQDPITTLILSDGGMLRCFVIDMSASGVAVSADIVPEIGAVLAVGKVAGKVVRHFPEGFAVQFQYPQNISKIEQLLIDKC